MTPREIYKGRHILVIDSYEPGHEMHRMFHARLGKHAEDISFADSYSLAREELERLKIEGKRVIVISDSVVREGLDYGPRGRVCTAELLKTALNNGYDVVVHTSGVVSADLRELVGVAGLHLTVKTSDHTRSSDDFFRQVLLPALELPASQRKV